MAEADNYANIDNFATAHIVLFALAPRITRSDAGYVNDKTFCTWQIHIQHVFTESIVVFVAVVVGRHRSRRGQGSHLI